MPVAFIYTVYVDVYRIRGMSWMFRQLLFSSQTYWCVIVHMYLSLQLTNGTFSHVWAHLSPWNMYRCGAYRTYVPTLRIPCLHSSHFYITHNQDKFFYRSTNARIDFSLFWKYWDNKIYQNGNAANHYFLAARAHCCTVVPVPYKQPYIGQNIFELIDCSSPNSPKV